MLTDKPEEQLVLFKEIITKKLTVREAESLSRRAATERIRNKGKYLDPAIMELERTFTESLGTRVRIEKNKEGGTVTIDFFSPEDLKALLDKINHETANKDNNTNLQMNTNATNEAQPDSSTSSTQAIDDRGTAEIKKEENEELYSLKNFSL